MTLHLRGAGGRLQQHIARLTALPVDARAHLTSPDFTREYGARPEDIAAVRKFVRNHGLRVVGIHRARRTVRISGTIEELTRAFRVDLGLYRSAGRVFRGRRGTIELPRWLEPAVVAVMGLDDRPAVWPHFRVAPPSRGTSEPARGPARTFDPTDLAQLYRFPPNATGAGQCIALLEFGGGYRLAELRRYFNRLGVRPPRVVAVPVSGTTNAPTGDPDSEDGEVVLDVEVAGAVAPGATITVYFAPNTDQGFADAVLAAVHDDSNKPSIISISWGLAEDQWTGQARRVLNQAFAAAAAKGIAVFAASGDNGSSDGVRDGRVHVDFPASSPHVVGCGGTSLQAANGAIAREVAWSESVDAGTGGGVSDVFPVPPFQRAVNPVSANPRRGTGRGVPDVAGNADPATGYRVMVDGVSTVLGGTSAVAPLWAGLAARVQERLGRPVAPILPALYSAPHAFFPVTQGTNGAYRAGPGWDACTGLGSPNGVALLAALRRA